MDHQYASTAPDKATPGLIAGLAGITKNLLALLISRVELAALELGEIRGTIGKFLLIYVIGAITAWFAIAFWSALAVVLAWETWGWKILLVMAAVFSLLTIGIFFCARTLIQGNKLALPATMAELRNDRDALL